MKVKLSVLGLIISGIMLGSCSTASTPADQPAIEEIPLSIADTRVISDGMLVPRESVDLAFTGGGEVAEVLVEEGDSVVTGDVIARLSGRERLESGVAAARLELQAAHSELLAAEIARKILDDNLSIVQTQALDVITKSKEAVRTFERRVRSLSSSADQADIDEAKATLILAEDTLEKAQDAYDPYADKSETNLVRATLLGKLAIALQRYDDARRLNNLQGITGDEFDLSQAETELQIAQSRLDQAEADYEMYLQGPDPDAVKLADSRIATAQVRVAAAESA